jgi:hydrogenase maturation protease
MGDEGIGVHVVRYLAKQTLPDSVTLMDGGTGGLMLLDDMRQAGRILIIDASADGGPAGTVRRLFPRYSKDYPRTLTAHDIGLKDLLDVFYLFGEFPDVMLFAVTIQTPLDVSADLTPELEAQVPGIAGMVLDEIRSAASRAGAA